MKHSVLFIFLILLINQINDVNSDEHKIEEEETENSRLEFDPIPKFQNVTPSVKEDNTHFLFQIHDAIHSLHTYYLNMLRNETLLVTHYGKNSDISHSCIKVLREFSRGLKENRIWALMMVDSVGKIPSGILEGTFYSRGDYRQCLDVNIPEKFQGQYCEVNFLQNIQFQYYPSDDPSEKVDLSYLHETNQSKIWVFDGKFPNGLHPVTTSICLPSKCSIEDIRYIVSKATSEAKENLKIQVSQCLVKSPWKYTKGQKMGMTLILVIIAIEVLATVFDIRCNFSQDKNANSSKKKFLQAILGCLSLRTHFFQLFQKDSGPESIKIFHGLKVLALFITIHFHSWSQIITQYFARLKHIFKMSTTIIGCFQNNSYIVVDILFFISGFLLLNSNIKSQSPSANIFYYVLRRYMRVWLPIAFLYGMSIFYFYLVEPLSLLRAEQLFVKQNRNWWKNALCINNFHLYENFLPMTWHLSAEMQLYTAAYFILLIYRRNPVKAMNVVKIINAVSLLSLAFCYYYFDYPPLLKSLFKKPSEVRKFAKIHASTLQHIAPYCVGMLTCDIIVTRKYRQMPKSVKFFGWFLSIILIYVTWIMPYIWNGNRIATVVESVIFGSLQRFLLSLVLGWITLSYCNGDRGILISVLSWDGFTPLSRLSFLAFVTHLFIFKLALNTWDNFIYSYSSGVAYTLNLTILTYSVSLVVYLVCEAPLNSMLKLFFAPSSKKIKI